MNISNNADCPSKPGEWPISRITEKLSRPLPDNLLESRTQGGRKIRFIPWYRVNRILDKYAPGWGWEIVEMLATGDRLIVHGRLSIPAAEGVVSRCATGTELLKDWRPIVVGGNKLADDYGRPVLEPVEIAYGDPSSNAESMAFRRAASRFGLGLYLKEQ